MSNEFIQAADDARRLLRGFAAIETVADAFEKVGQLEQRKAEGESILASLTTEIGAARETLNTVIGQVEDVRVEAKRTTADAKTVADGIMSSANAHAKSLVEDAMAAVREAQEAKDNVVATAQTHLADLEAKRDAVLAETTDLEARATAAREYLANLKG